MASWLELNHHSLRAWPAAAPCHTCVRMPARPQTASCFLYVPSCPAGTRLMAVLLTSLITPLRVLPLVPNLLLQVYSVAMVRVGNKGKQTRGPM